MAAKKITFLLDSGVVNKTSHHLELYAIEIHKTSYKLQRIARLFKNFTLSKPIIFCGEQKSPALYYFLLAIQAMKLFLIKVNINFSYPRLQAVQNLKMARAFV